MKLIKQYFNHEKRKNDLLEKYPEIKECFGYDKATKYIALILVFVQLYISINIKEYNIYKYVFCLYFISATITQCLFLMIHEISHNLLFKKQIYNIYFGMFVNLPLIFPFSYSFREYHLEHHSHQGNIKRDMDIPTNLEINWLKQNILTRLIWLSLQIIMYAIRPIIMYPKPLNKMKVINTLIQYLFNIMLYKYFGIEPFIYLILSLLIAGGIHPTSGHFISEHVFFDESGYYDTQSYYGILNLVTLNVGYHNEHHDFPNIAWTKLPKLNKICNEEYSQAPYCKSWINILWNFVVGKSCRFYT
tara:strand:- start:2871 stop:3779 length:909 start_codon:yes stop_codon:yes gene_type:complete